MTDVVNDVLAPVQTRYQELLGDEQSLRRVLELGADRARPVADVTLRRVQRAVGLR